MQSDQMKSITQLSVCIISLDQKLNKKENKIRFLPNLRNPSRTVLDILERSFPSLNKEQYKELYEKFYFKKYIVWEKLIKTKTENLLELGFKEKEVEIILPYFDILRHMGELWNKTYDEVYEIYHKKITLLYPSNDNPTEEKPQNPKSKKTEFKYQNVFSQKEKYDHSKEFNSIEDQI